MSNSKRMKYEGPSTRQMGNDTKLDKAPYIPGLTKEIIQGQRGSMQNFDGIPQILTMEKDEDGRIINANWSVKGTSTYILTLKCKNLQNIQPSYFKWDNFVITCSCPYGKKRKELICQHGYKCLTTVVDTTLEAEEKKIAEEKRKKLEKIAKEEAEKEAKIAEEKAKKENKLAKEQELALPGERDRILRGLETIERYINLKEFVLEKCNESVESLEHLSKLFPQSLMPKISDLTTKCERCGMFFAPAYNTDKSCQMDHPNDCLQFIEKYEYECIRCLNAFYQGRKRKVLCFVGTHTIDKELVEDEEWDQIADGC
ncbi:CLUMA_CG008444, isoform A [Clunio marinus]|uniref:CLUMA_CG008444, isoform A n=1 Tax=Clunio marinus TaxID=568069 RepID=A0A1J1I5U6_9DIPT|nr:CLUMA_CG008444, isoform A [Clunio marinus]